MVWVVVAVVELFSPVTVVNVVEIAAADGVIGAVPVRRVSDDGRPAPVGVGISDQREEAAAVETLAFW